MKLLIFMASTILFLYVLREIHYKINPYAECYENMESAGIAVFGGCNGCDNTQCPYNINKGGEKE